MQLADGKKLSVVGFSTITLDFGFFVCDVKVDIIDAKIPSILGMPFLHTYNPTINWNKRTLTILRGGRPLVIKLTKHRRFVEQTKTSTFQPTSRSYKDALVNTYVTGTSNAFAELENENADVCAHAVCETENDAVAM